MRTVKVRKGDLSEKVVANRKRHFDVFADAVKGWRSELEQAAATVRRLADEGADDNLLEEARQEVYRLSRPEEHLDEYDQVITMLEMSIDDEIELSWQEFQQYVMDNWTWKEVWKMSNSRYTTVERA